MKPVDYKQFDSRWASHDYSAKGEKTNLYVSGCGPTSAADIIAAIKDANVTPVTCANWSVAHGYKAVGAGTYNTYFVPQLNAYGIKCEYLNSYCYHNLNHPSHAKVKEALKNGKWVIANAGPGNWTSGGHFIVAYQVDANDNVYICDPASNAAARLKNTFNTFAYQMKYYWIVDVPKTTTTPTVPSSSTSSTKKKQHLSYGDVNNDVGVAQKMLKELGYYKGAIDNSFGKLMLEAVKAFQKAYKLEVDGLYGPNTKAATETAYNKKIASNNANTFVVNKVYTLKYDLKVRSGAGTNYGWKKYSQLTADGKKHAYSSNSYAVLKVGTQVTVLEVKKLSNGEIWVRIPSGWVCAVQNGIKYIG